MIDNTSSHQQLELHFEPIELPEAGHTASLIDVSETELADLLEQESIRNAEVQQQLDSYPQPQWNTQRSIRDRVLIDVLGFPEGDSPSEVIKTGLWEFKESLRERVPAYYGAVKNIDKPMRRAALLAITGGVLTVGLLAQEALQDEGASQDRTAPVIEMPKNISIAYSVPKSNPRVMDLASALDVEPKVIIEQLDKTGRDLEPETPLKGGTILKLKVQGTDYKPPTPQSFEHVVQEFNLTGSTLIAANPELAGMGNDSLISSEITIPKPVTIVRTPRAVNPEEVAQIPVIKEAIDEGQNIADTEKGIPGDIYIITDPTLVEESTTTVTESTAAKTTTIPEAPTTTVLELEPIEKISPQVARVNAALAAIKIDGKPIDLTELTEAVKAMYASYRPNDKDRLPNTPEGYVKMMLAHEAVGISVPFTVAERTADVERYTSAETYAVGLGSAQVYQLRAANYPGLEGTMARIRDGDGPVHMDHNDGTSLDISGAEDFDVTQYSDGPFADFQFSAKFNKAFTEDVFADMAKFVINGKPAVRRILSSGQTMAPTVNARVGRAIMRIQKYHKDHAHLVMNTDYTLPRWRPRLADLPWNETQDLKIGLPNNGISKEQHDSQHLDFEKYISERLQKIAKRKAAIGASTTTTSAPAPTTTEAPKATDLDTIVDSLDATDAQKDFLKRVSRQVVEVSDKYRLNPNAVIAQAGFESGWAQSPLSKSANNLFGMKISEQWDGPFVELMVGPEGAKYLAKFRKYSSIEESIADYAKVIDNRPWYDDAQIHSKDTKLYLRALLDELNADGSVAKHQGDEGVRSYDHTTDYDELVLGIIDHLKINQIVDAVRETKEK